MDARVSRADGNVAASRVSALATSDLDRATRTSHRSTASHDHVTTGASAIWTSGSTTTNVNVTTNGIVAVGTLASNDLNVTGHCRKTRCQTGSNADVATGRCAAVTDRQTDVTAASRSGAPSPQTNVPTCSIGAAVRC